MSMQTDVKAAYVDTTATVYNGRARLRSVLVTPGSAAGTVVIRDGGASGTVVVSMPRGGLLTTLLTPVSRG